MSMIGKTLAHYEITNQLGKGGMGEVYQAKDRKLGRDVAIKVLLEEFARDTGRVARFQREAKLLASLNHPSIAAIHGLEESEGTTFLVLELVEGQTLADRIKAGPIPVEESLKLALQITEALEAAHEKGVIHRDLKPSNIKVTPEGKVKVLDFGLAKAFAGDQEEIVSSDSPTLTITETQKGVILGTAAYMSPEQARGKSVDRRADIWAFGCVLFEMLAGRAVFSGKDVTDILAGVIRSEPDWSRLPANLHWRIREMLERCLEKEARDRCSGINDARVEIQKALADPGGVLTQRVTTGERRSKLRTILPWVAAAIVLSLIVGGVAVWKLKPPEPRRVIRLDHQLPQGQQFIKDLPSIEVSADGSQFVYATPGGLYLRSIDELDARLIAGTEKMPSSPFFSPDGKWIGYWSSADSRLKKIPTAGGAPVDLCEVKPLLVTAIWNTDDTIIFGQVTKGIMRISANGGTPELLVPGKLMCIYPQLLPDGKSVMFTDAASQPYRTMVHSLESGKEKELFPGIGARYLPTGHIVYAALGANYYTLFAVPFNLDRLEAAGEPVPIFSGVSFHALSDSGTLVYAPAPTGTSFPNQRTLVWVERKGKEEPLAATPKDYRGPRISPDGTKAALTIYADGKTDIWIWDFVRETMTRLTFDEASTTPLWILDGKGIAFSSSRGAKASTANAVYWKAADGTGEDEKLGSEPDRVLYPSSWSGDGKTLVLMEFTAGANAGFDIGTLSMQGDRKRKTLLKEKYQELYPQISRNGRWMAYVTDESGKAEVYVRPFPDVEGGRWQASTSGGDYNPLWSPDGRELFYRNGDEVMSVSVETEPTFKLGKTMPLFRGMYAGDTVSNIDFHPWDISPDGKRFLMMKNAVAAGKPAAAEPPRKLNIILNWTEELKQRVPIK